MKREYIIPSLFVLMITVGMLLIFILPKEDISSDEQRRLAEMPEFTVSNISSGRYTTGINSYLNDHFPFRKKFIDLGHDINSVLRHSSGELEIVTNAGGTNTTDNGEFVEAVGDLILYNNRAMEIFRYDYSTLVEYATSLNLITYGITEKSPSTKVYSLLAPTSTEFYAPKDYRTANRSQKEAIAGLRDLLAPEIISVDAYSRLAAKTDDYIYYNTDHHWTVRGAYEGYAAFCGAAGFTPFKPGDKYFVEGAFLGTFYNSSKNEILTKNPDYVEVYLPPEIESCTGFADAQMNQPYQLQPLVDPGEESNKYMAFLGGDCPFIRITTPVKNGRKLLLIKDSYSNAMALFFAENFEEIYILDPRLTTLNVPEFCANNGISDVLFANYAFVLSNTGMSELLSKLIS